jgi:hypothetical protein
MGIEGSMEPLENNASLGDNESFFSVHLCVCFVSSPYHLYQCFGDTAIQPSRWADKQMCLAWEEHGSDDPEDARDSATEPLDARAHAARYGSQNQMQ